MNRKRPFSRSRKEYLVLYHLNHIIRYKEDELLWLFCMGYPILYHSLLFSPYFYIGIPAGKVSGVFLYPGILGGFFSFLLTLGVGTCLLSLSYPVIRCIVFSTENAFFGHRYTPLFFYSINGYDGNGGQKTKKGKTLKEKTLPTAMRHTRVEDCYK